MCVFDQAHSTLKWDWADRGKDRLQNRFTVNSNTVVLGTWKINKMRSVRMAEKGSKTILPRGFTDSIKSILKTIKLTENTDIRKAMAIHWRDKWPAGTLVSALRVAKIRSNLHTGQYAGEVPSDHGQRQALVEPLSLRRVAWNVNEFLCKKAQCRCCNLSGRVALVVIQHERDVREEQKYAWVERASNNKRDCGAWSLLLLAAMVRSFAHRPLGISDRNKMVL